MPSPQDPSERAVESIVGGADRPLRESTPVRDSPEETKEVLSWVQNTPKEPSTSSLSLGYKHPRLVKKMTNENDPRHVEVPVETFMDAFLSPHGPTKQQLRHLPRYTGLKNVGKKGKEDSMYPTLCTNFNKVIEACGSQLVCKDVANWPEDGLHDMKPDLAFYRRVPPGEAEPWALSEEACEKTDEDRKPHVARVSWAAMEIFVEVKRQEANSGYCFSQIGKNKGFLRDSDDGRTARGQNALYATEKMLRQHRLHALSLYVAGGFLRAFYWDRNGIVVSEAINMKKKPGLTNTFLWRMFTVNDRQMGHDPTVRLAGPEDLRKLSLYDPQGPGSKYLEEYYRHMWDHQRAFPIHKVECKVVSDNGEPGPTSKAFLIGQYVSHHYTTVGRATKGFVAYDLEEDRLCFLKDQWRTNCRGSHPELETYARLKKHNVSRVATAIAGGDVEEEGHGLQRTVSQEYIAKYRKSEDVKIPAERVHTRLVLREVGRPLEQYDDSIDLILMCGHALLAHKEAWEKADVLHRDVSAANIMFNVESSSNDDRGFLNDWDLCKYKEDLDDPLANASQPFGISGTWPFLPASTLLYPRKRSEVADDQESIIYILVYFAFRFHPHHRTPLDIPEDADVETITKANTANNSLAGKIFNMFHDDSLATTGFYSAGEYKQMWINSGTPPVKLKDQNSPLAKLLRKCFHLLRSHYKAIDYEALEPYKLTPMPSSALPASENDANDTKSDQVKKKPDIARVERDEHFFARPYGASAPARPVRASPARSDSSGSTASSHTVRSRKLDTHDALWELFATALDDETPASLERYVMDKIFDQFLGLQAILRQSSSRARGPAAKEIGSKRSSSEAELDGSSPGSTGSPQSPGSDPPSPAKRPKTSEPPPEPVVAPAAPTRVTRSTPALPAPLGRVTRSMAAKARGRGQRMECVLVPMRTTRAAAARNTRRSRR